MNSHKLSLFALIAFATNYTHAMSVQQTRSQIVPAFITNNPGKTSLVCMGASFAAIVYFAEKHEAIRESLIELEKEFQQNTISCQDYHKEHGRLNADKHKIKKVGPLFLATFAASALAGICVLVKTFRPAASAK